MTIKYVSKFLYRSSNIDEKYFEKIIKQPLPFENTEYELRISGTVETDQRVMSFIDPLWGFEVTGGSDQYEPLTIVDVTGYIPVRRSGYAFRAGIRTNDVITRINNTYTDDMTLLEAQMIIRKSGKNLQIFVRSDDDPEECDEFTVDFWFKPRKKFPPVHIVNKWPDTFNWNDRRKPIYKESNCFMVPSKNEEKIHQEDQDNRAKTPIIQTESDENTTMTFADVEAAQNAKNAANGLTVPNKNEENVHQEDRDNRAKTPIIQTESDENTTMTFADVQAAASAENAAKNNESISNGITNGTHKESDATSEEKK